MEKDTAKGCVTHGLASDDWTKTHGVCACGQVLAEWKKKYGASEPKLNGKGLVTCISVDRP